MKTFNQYVSEHIVKHGSGYRLLSHKGKNLGTFPTHAGAVNHEREVLYFKSKTNEDDMPEAGTEPFEDTISGEGPSGSPAVTEYQHFLKCLEAELDTSDEHDAVPNFEVLEGDEDELEPHAIVPGFGLTDRLFTEVDDADVVPADIAIDGRLYTESKRWKN